MNESEKCCAFTGPRPQNLPWKNDETDSRCVKLKAVLDEQIAALASSGVIHYLSGMAEAVDVWSAMSVLALREKNPRLKLHCILPCTTQADKWTVPARKLYRSILEQADSIVYVSRNYHGSCMLDRNRFLVDHASILLAVCKDSSQRRSGTAATVRYAQTLNRDIIIIDPITRRISREGVHSEPA